MNCCFCPRGIEAAAGVTAIETRLGATPAPLSETDCGLLLALSVIFSSPPRDPSPPGEKLTEMVQLLPAPRVLGLNGHLLPITKSDRVEATEVIERAFFCPFLSVTCFAALVVPNDWLPNDKLLGVMLTDWALTVKTLMSAKQAAPRSFEAPSLDFTATSAVDLHGTLWSLRGVKKRTLTYNNGSFVTQLRDTSTVRQLYVDLAGCQPANCESVVFERSAAARVDRLEFIRLSGMTHVRTSPFYPQSNGKIERWHKSLKRECIRPLTLLTLDDARRLIQIYVDHYNTVRLHSAIGYVTPQDRLTGRQAEIHAARDRKLEEARSQRQLRRQQTTSSRVARFCNAATMTSLSETEAGSAGTQPC